MRCKASLAALIGTLSLLATQSWAADTKTVVAIPHATEQGRVESHESGASHGLPAPNSWQRDYDLGNRALDNRFYGQAEQRLSHALPNMRKTRSATKEIVLAQLSLAEAYMGLNKLDRARVMLDEVKAPCQSIFGAESKEMARYYSDSANLHLADGRTVAAVGAARENLKIAEKSIGAKRELALAQALMGKVLCKESYYEDAKEILKKALVVLEVEPGKDRLDYADALISLATAAKKLGDERESAEAMDTALALKDGAVVLYKSQDQKGVVKFNWVEGMHGSRQITDPEYPLKYLVVGGVRVACTLVRSYKHVAVLISLANCTDHPLHLAVGAVTLEKISPGRKEMVFCDPGLIDEVLEEDVILDRTWRRRTLCHIEKSRKIPGYLKNGSLDPDDFFGNNTFGLYGAWDNNLRDAPPIVTREQYFYDDKPKAADAELLGFMRGNGSVRPTFIETGGARTGVVFFLRERYDDAIVRIHLGNAELEFPFHVAPGQ